MQSTSTIPSNGMSTSNSIADSSDRAHDAVNASPTRLLPWISRSAIHRPSTGGRSRDPAVECDGKWPATRGSPNELAETASGYIRARPLAAVAGALVLAIAGQLMR
jgi:hypothetical protein